MSPFGPSDDLDEIAARNNADWCVAVWRTHGLTVEDGPGLVLCPARTPRFYPNAVTVERGASPADQVAAIAVLCAARPDIPLAVKDSFARLDLAPLGFTELITSPAFSPGVWQPGEGADAPGGSADPPEVTGPVAVRHRVAPVLL